jgi:hypothetical protein
MLNRDNDERYRMRNLAHEAFRYFEVEPGRGMAMLNEGRTLAEKLNESCYVLYYDYWRCDLLLFYLNDPLGALDLSVRTAVEANKPANRHCSDRARVLRVMVDAFLYTDPVGYADKIRENIDFIERETNPDLDTWRILQWQRGYLEMALDDLDAALDASLVYLDRCGNSDFRLSDAYSLLAEVCYRRGELKACYDYAQLGEIHARRSSTNTKRWLLEFLAWEALCARTFGEEDIAQTKFRLATTQAARLEARPFAAYYDGLCAYHEHAREYEFALKLRDQQLGEVLSSRSPYAEAECRLRRCRLLSGMGKPFDNELSTARETAKRLIAPESFLKKLDLLADTI